MEITLLPNWAQKWTICVWYDDLGVMMVWPYVYDTMVWGSWWFGHMCMGMMIWGSWCGDHMCMIWWPGDHDGLIICMIWWPGDHDGLIICVSHGDMVVMMPVSYDVFMMIWWPWCWYHMMMWWSWWWYHMCMIWGSYLRIYVCKTTLY